MLFHIYGDKSFTWNSGRNLATITDSSNNDSISYTYNRYGYRTGKAVNGVATNYIVDENGTVVAQKTGNDTLYFEYDNYGSPLGFVYNGIQYLYITNIRNDVIAITDTTGTVVAGYTYGDWGECTVDSTSTNLALANLNPLRYRGYYYDNETGYYYLQRRYYDPSICRFINSDIAEISQMSKDIPVGNNLFAYCNNDPVNKTDTTGYWVWLMSGWRITSVGFNVYMDKKFLSRPFCKSFAKFVVNHYGNGNKFRKMSKHRIEVELWAHAVGYYAGTILNKVNKSWGKGWISSGFLIEVNYNDPREWKFYAVWAMGSTIKTVVTVSKIPSIIKIASYVIL